MTPIFFATPSDFRAWLEENHHRETALLVGFYKVGSDKPSITWSQSVDEALCFGWIDGVRKSLESDSYCIRFTPRKTKSIWSAVNIRKVEELTNQGRMQPSGLAIFNQREESRSKIYSYEKEPVKLDEAYENKFRLNQKAWTFFQSQASYYRNRATNWVMSARQEITRVSRLDTLISVSEEERRT
ncbi:MAG: YdeI/OmpD-associated family protein [Ferruginibacter sp.]|nr:YdeI/OmpD-associated family protein [Cytophagales bacterium]